MAYLAVGVPVRGDVGGGFDVWLPLYVFLSLLFVMAVNGWLLTIRRAVIAVVFGTVWSWSVNVVGVIPAAAVTVLVAIVARAVLRRARQLSAGDA